MPHDADEIPACGATADTLPMRDRSRDDHDLGHEP
jgi:hypothetical protein